MESDKTHNYLVITNDSIDQEDDRFQRFQASIAPYLKHEILKYNGFVGDLVHCVDPNSENSLRSLSIYREIPADADLDFEFFLEIVDANCIKIKDELRLRTCFQRIKLGIHTSTIGSFTETGTIEEMLDVGVHKLELSPTDHVNKAFSYQNPEFADSFTRPKYLSTKGERLLLPTTVTIGLEVDTEQYVYTLVKHEYEQPVSGIVFPALILKPIIITNS